MKASVKIVSIFQISLQFFPSSPVIWCSRVIRVQVLNTNHIRADPVSYVCNVFEVPFNAVDLQRFISRDLKNETIYERLALMSS